MQVELLAQTRSDDGPTVIHVPQWGCGLMIAAAVLLVAAVIRAARRAAAAERRETAKRRDETVDALAARGMEAEHDTFPVELPDLPLVPRRGRPKACLRVTAEGAGLSLFEHVHPGSSHPLLGRNAEQTGSGGESGLPSYTNRHTVACVRRPGRTWPEMELLPSFAGALRRAAAGELAAEGDDSPLASGLEMANKLLGITGKLFDSRTPVPLDERPDLAARYVAYGPEGEAVLGFLSNPIAEWLLARPGTILCLSGEWLLVSRNVRLAGVSGWEDVPEGFLPPAAAADLAADAVALGRLVGEAGGARGLDRGLEPVLRDQHVDVARGARYSVDRQGDRTRHGVLDSCLVERVEEPAGLEEEIQRHAGDPTRDRWDRVGRSPRAWSAGPVALEAVLRRPLTGRPSRRTRAPRRG